MSSIHGKQGDPGVQSIKNFFAYSIAGAVGVVGIISVISYSLPSSLASVPSSNRVTDDTAIYQSLSEIKLPRERSPNFDADLAKLRSNENFFRETLPSSRSLRLVSDERVVQAARYSPGQSRRPTNPAVSQAVQSPMNRIQKRAYKPKVGPVPQMDPNVVSRSASDYLSSQARNQ